MRPQNCVRPSPAEAFADFLTDRRANLRCFIKRADHRLISWHGWAIKLQGSGYGSTFQHGFEMVHRILKPLNFLDSRHSKIDQCVSFIRNNVSSCPTVDHADIQRCSCLVIRHFLRGNNVVSQLFDGVAPFCVVQSRVRRDPVRMELNITSPFARCFQLPVGQTRFEAKNYPCFPGLALDSFLEVWLPISSSEVNIAVNGPGSTIRFCLNQRIKVRTTAIPPFISSTPGPANFPKASRKGSLANVPKSKTVSIWQRIKMPSGPVPQQAGSDFRPFRMG